MSTAARNKLVFAIAIGLMAFLPSAHASQLFILTVDGCTGGCGVGPFGQITLEQTTPTLVTVTEVLYDSNLFAGSGAGDALEFNVSGPVTLGSITPGFAVGPAPDSASAFGIFLLSITCTVCQGGNASNPPGPLSFTVTSATGVSISDFFANAGGYYFSSDIGGGNGNTGNVAATAGVITHAPEPLSLSLIGLGLVGIGVLKRRTRR
jgi:hypothetical protein